MEATSSTFIKHYIPIHLTTSSVPTGQIEKGLDRLGRSTKRRLGPFPCHCRCGLCGILSTSGEASAGGRRPRSARHGALLTIWPVPQCGHVAQYLQPRCHLRAMARLRHLQWHSTHETSASTDCALRMSHSRKSMSGLHESRTNHSGVAVRSGSTTAVTW